MLVTHNTTLPIGYQIENYNISRVLSTSGFSIVYLASDQNHKLIALKEYMPSKLKLRMEGFTVQPLSERDERIFKHGLKCFFEEGLVLSNIHHHNIVRVLNFFRANNTVYMAMKYESGFSLQQEILENTSPLNEHFVRKLFVDLTKGLRVVHTHELLHLDIKPANILVRKDQSPVLLDFGSARRILTGEMDSLLHTFTSGFASPEHYNNREKLGPWSDIYSLGASMYACLARTAPVSADKRLLNDTLTPAKVLGKDIYSSELLTIIDKCLSLDPLIRPQSVLSLKKELLKTDTIPVHKVSLFKQAKTLIRFPQ